MTPLEETLRALEDLVRRARCSIPARQQLAAWQVAKRAGHLGAQRLGALRGAAADVQPGQAPGRGRDPADGEAEGLAVIPYSPTGGGLLTGKYPARRPAAGS